MKFAHFFIDRPIFATVLSTVIVLVGALAYSALPVEQFPEVAPPIVQVLAFYPGANSEVIADTVAAPLEEAINGVENMLYMSSYSTSDGTMTLNVTFEVGTDLDDAQIEVQNRINAVLPRLPEEVRRLGITANEFDTNILLVAHLLSPNKRYDELYVSNYAFLQIKDALARVDGVGAVQIFGAREYSMRVWLDPFRLAGLDLTAGDVLGALREQNVQIAAGILGQQPMPTGKAFQVTVSAQGRLRDASEFSDIVVKTDGNGRIVRLKDVARVELGALDYSLNSYLNQDRAVAVVVFPRPGSNALRTAQAVQAKLDELSQSFPEGLEHFVVYNPTVFVEDSFEAVQSTFFDASLLVVIVVLLFLQSWRATLIPLLAIPVSLIGTFAVMAAFGFSLNSLTLFGLVLAIGIVVDDAIVVVENVERNLDAGLKPRDATRKAMTEITTALISTSLVLIAVFVPVAFIGGISGQFYRQFALTIAVSTAISTFVSLTLSPAMAAFLLRPKGGTRTLFGKVWSTIFGPIFKVFNFGFDKLSQAYGAGLSRLLRKSAIALLVYVGLAALTVFSFGQVPTGFVPPQDQGYCIIALQLPDGASLERTDAVSRKVIAEALETKGVRGAVAFAGFSGATFSNSSSAGAIFAAYEDFDKRPGISSTDIEAELWQRVSQIQEAAIFVIPPPAVNGLGNGGGFRLFVQDRGGVGFTRLQEATAQLAMAANQEPGVMQVFSSFRANTPRLYADIDRTRAKMLGVPLTNIFETLQAFLSSVYVNDFNFLGRTYRVTTQGEPQYRDEPSDITQLRTRTTDGQIVPLGSLIDVQQVTGPDWVVRYNLFPSADLSGNTMPGYSTGEALDIMERLAAEHLPPEVDYEWTEMAYQERQTGNTAIFIFFLSVVFVFLTLAAQYESWSLPIAVILIVPLSLLGAIAGLWLRGMDNNILTQIGFIVLVGLASKNAILIVEFARQLEEKGTAPLDAAFEASRLRLRPILMTSFTFILGVLPLLVATGAGAEMRQAIGTAVFSGMLGVTFFGLIFTPIFYSVIRGALKVWSSRRSAPVAVEAGAE